MADAGVSDFPNGYLRCPKGPGATRPHTWKCGRIGNVCAACGMTRGQVYGRPEPQVRMGGWAQIRPHLLRDARYRRLARQARGYVESIDAGCALVRFPVTTDDGQPWPFPLELTVPVEILAPAPRPRFVETKA